MKSPIDMELKQQQILAPQLYQSLKILQLNCVQLDEYLRNEFLENPVLELDEPDSLSDDIKIIDYINHSVLTAESSNDDNDEYQYPEVFTQDENYTLREHLISQFDSSISGQEARVLGTILDNLDDKGYLVLSSKEICANYGYGEELVNYGIEYLQTLDPSGVCARDLTECLCIQLKRLGYKDPVLFHIAGEHLGDIAAGKYNKIALKLGLTSSETRDKCRIIKSLNPKPGVSFYESTVTPVIIPDVLVAVDNGVFSLTVNTGICDRLHISSYYSHIAKQDEYGEATAYLKEKLINARWLIKAIEKRKDTLSTISEFIVDYQREYFLHKNASLKPLTIRQAATQLGLHESTVSRAVNGKYLQCLKGTYPLKHFFAVAASKCDTNTAVSHELIKNRIREILAGEDKNKPLSDQHILEIIMSEGIHLSRRVIAKYRSDINIPSSGARKQS